MNCCHLYQLRCDSKEIIFVGQRQDYPDRPWVLIIYFFQILSYISKLRAKLKPAEIKVMVCKVCNGMAGLKSEFLKHILYSIRFISPIILDNNSKLDIIDNGLIALSLVDDHFLQFLLIWPEGWFYFNFNLLVLRRRRKQSKVWGLEKV